MAVKGIAALTEAISVFRGAAISILRQARDASNFQEFAGGIAPVGRLVGNHIQASHDISFATDGLIYLEECRKRARGAIRSDGCD